MKFNQKKPPRTFWAGKDGRIEIKDCGDLFLEADEQITLKTKTGTELDVTRKAWGYYPLPSLNKRLPEFGLRPALVVSRTNDRYFILLVEPARMDEFERYLASERMDVVTWLDDPEALGRLSK